MAKIDIYDERGKCIGEMERAQALRKGYWHRNSYVLPVCGDGHNIILLQRSGEKAVYKEGWAPVAEHPFKGEKDIDAAVRGVKEDLRIDIDRKGLVDLRTKLKVHLFLTPQYSVREFQAYYGMKLPDDTLDRLINDPSSLGRENTVAQMVPANQVGIPPYGNPLGEDNVAKVMRALVRKGLLDPSSISDRWDEPTRKRFFHFPWIWRH